jgi:urease accessory protein UreE
MASFDESYTIIGSRVLNIRRSDEVDAQRAAWIDLIWRDPAAARRERRRLRIEAAQKRVAEIEIQLKRTERRARNQPWLYDDVAALRRDLQAAREALEAAEQE